MPASPALALDIEFDGDTILCAASCWSDGFVQVPQIWTTQGATKFEPLSQPMIEALVDTLWSAHAAGTTLLTWGGTGSDWVKLAKAVPHCKDQIKEMALNSVDIPLVSAAANGMMMGLTASALGMGLGSRPACDSAEVPALWASGNAVQQFEVVQHVKWDAWATLELFHRLMLQAPSSRPQLTWITQRSGPRAVRLRRSHSPSGDYELPRVKELLTWEAPKTTFPIPDHLKAEHALQWLK